VPHAPEGREGPDAESPKPSPLEHETVVDEVTDPPARAKRWRMALLALFFVGSLGLVKATGADAYLDVETVRAFMESWGAWGFFGFVILFALGELMHVPGLVFVGAASVAYGPVLGSAAAFVGALGSVTVSFFVVRGIGGQPLGDVRKPWMRKILGRLDTQPLRTVTVLRLIFWMAPALNYGLAMSSVRFRHYFLGSVLGMLIPIPLAVVFFDWLAAWLL
jgi:uncharacterized membrane protein YdjX (TVP38/TMEM64 family)